MEGLHLLVTRYTNQIRVPLLAKVSATKLEVTYWAVRKRKGISKAAFEAFAGTFWQKLTSCISLF